MVVRRQNVEKGLRGTKLRDVFDVDVWILVSGEFKFTYPNKTNELSSFGQIQLC